MSETLTLEQPAAPSPAASTPATKRSLVGLDRAGLRAALIEAGVAEREAKMRVQQLWHWIYWRGAADFDQMTNVGKSLRKSLADHFTLDRPTIVSEQASVDGTRKWLLRMPAKGPHDRGAEIECVYIPESDRGTLCVSSQVGCTLTCAFCHTGTQKLVRNLDAAEIVAQMMVARDRLGEWPDAATPEGVIAPQPKSGLPDLGNHFPNSGKPDVGGGRLVSNIVLMGMGEPLYNFDNVKTAVDVMSDGEGLALSRRRVTLSTAGVAPMIPRAGEEIGTMLAISLHAVRDDLRNVLVPLNKKYPIKDLLDACRAYPGLSNAKRITFEYVMLKGVNDSLAEAKELVRLLKGVPAKINLIPFNPWPGTTYECSDWEQIERFSDIVFNAGYASPIRTPRGRDILAACGQLKSETEKMRARARLMLESGVGEAGLYAATAE